MKDYYRILQITPSASQEEVKKAYRRLAKAHHPDLVGAGTGVDISIHDINEAYRTLSHPGKRSHYDWVRTNQEAYEQAINNQIASIEVKSRYYSYPKAGAKSKRQVPSRIKPYLRYTYAVSRISLVFCFLLLIDFFMPLRQRIDKITYLTEVRSQSGNAEVHDYTQLHTWQGNTAFVNSDASTFFQENPSVHVFKTRIFGKLRYIASAKHVKKRFIHSRSIYGNFIFIPFLLLLTAFLGSIKYFKPELHFSFGVASGVLLLISSMLLLV